MHLNLLRQLIFQIVLQELTFRKKKTTAFVLGTVNYRGQQSLGGRTKGPSKYNEKFPELYDALQDLIETYHPDFSYTTIQVNKNVKSLPHIDMNNVGPSYIIGLGDYDGGDLVIEGFPYNIKNRWKRFDGRDAHWVEPYIGTRYSIVYFTHTFKPPHPSYQGIKITKKGIYKKGKMIKEF